MEGPILSYMGSQLGRMGLNMYNKSVLGQKTPNEMSAVHAYEPLGAAAIQRAADIAPDASPLQMAISEYVPEDGKPFSTLKAAGHSKSVGPDGKERSTIHINPNTDRAYFAHELGHAVAQKTDVGNFVNQAKRTMRKNPKLGISLATALGYSLPAVTSALQEGDDDFLESIALAAAVHSPTLVDEALATKNGLAIMNDAGMRATAGQRGRLAGGYLTYLAPVILAGAAGNVVGNVADDYTAVYDL